jgi:hypothetical protein
MKGFAIIVFVLIWCSSFSQTIPPLKPLRYDEDYSFLKKDSVKSWYSKMKFSSLSKSKQTYISFGGEMRFQYFYAKNEQWGDVPQDDDGYILSRWLVHADFHAGQHFRTFVQLQSSLSNSRPDPNPVEDNPLELHQAFVDINANISPASRLTFRIGRQELLYGSQRLVSVRDNPNNRQSFDALRSIFQSPKYRVDLFYSHYVAAKPNIFDDGFNKNVKFWGAYIVRNKVPVLKNIDFYYLGLWKRHAGFDDGEGEELRHSIGTRVWNNNRNWSYDFEALYQFGKFAGKNISAWTASINTTYQFTHVRLKPILGIKTELISGDKKYDDDRLQTFNPLFPRGAYFGLAALIGPVNLIDAHPSLSLNLSEKISFDIDYDLFWRYSRNDGLYATNASLIYSGEKTSEKHIGNQLTGSLVYRPNNFLYFRSEFTWFNASGYLKAASAGKDILFTGITAQLKF